jgi:hypothetical protein
MTLTDRGMALEIANAHGAGGDKVLAPPTVATASTNAVAPDYAWTQSAPVEGFFIVLTVVVVPVAILRGLRRLRALPFVVGAWRRRGVNP